MTASTWWTWATITTAGPGFRVRLDGDTAPLPYTPASLIDPLTLKVGDRVRCEVTGRRVIVHGATDGAGALAAYPVGAIYLSVNAVDPGTIFGGIWVAFGAGRVLAGVGGSTFVAPAERTGGAETHTHSTPAHAHALTGGYADINVQPGVIYYRNRPGAAWTANNTINAGWGAGSTLSQGAGVEIGGTTATDGASTTGAGSSMPPWINVYMWKRTA